MTDQTNAELIAEARTHVTDEYITPDTSAEESLIRRLASALEAAEKRATYPEAERSFLSAEWERIAKSQRQTINRLEQEKAEVWRVAADELEAMRIERDNWRRSAEEAERAEQRAEKRAEEAERLAEVRRETIREYGRENESWSVRAHTAERERNQLAAVVEKALRPENIDYGHVDIAIERVREALTTAPDDTLREVKAEAWQEGAYRVYNSTLDEAEWWWSDWASENPYKAREEKP